MYDFFLSYNRDEMCPLTDKKGEHFVEKISDTIIKNNESIYFDNLDFKKLDKTIFENIEKIMNQENTKMLLVTNQSIFYGWTEREILSAIAHTVPIYKIKIKKFIKFFITKNWSISKIIDKKTKRIF